MNPEKWKYKTIYQQEQPKGFRRGYGRSNHGSGMMLELVQAASVLDVGCGHNDLIKDIRLAVFNNRKNSKMTSNISDEEYADTLLTYFVGVDFACPSADFVADVLEGLPFEDKAFQYVTAFDTLEHLRENQLHDALTEMRRVSYRFVFTISHVPSKHTVNGQTLHPTVKSPDWWRGLLMQFSDDVVYEGGYFKGKWNA